MRTNIPDPRLCEKRPPVYTGSGVYIQDPGGRGRLNEIAGNPDTFVGPNFSPDVLAKIRAGTDLTADEIGQVKTAELTHQTGLSTTGQGGDAAGQWNGQVPDRGVFGHIPEGSVPFYGFDGQLKWITPDGNVRTSDGRIAHNTNTLSPQEVAQWREVTARPAMRRRNTRQCITLQDFFPLCSTA